MGIESELTAVSGKIRVIKKCSVERVTGATTTANRKGEFETAFHRRTDEWFDFEFLANGDDRAVQYQFYSLPHFNNDDCDATLVMRNGELVAVGNKATGEFTRKIFHSSNSGVWTVIMGIFWVLGFVALIITGLMSVWNEGGRYALLSVLAFLVGLAIFGIYGPVTKETNSVNKRIAELIRSS